MRAYYVKSRRAYACPVNHKMPGTRRMRAYYVQSRRAYARPVNHKRSGIGPIRANESIYLKSRRAFAPCQSQKFRKLPSLLPSPVHGTELLHPLWSPLLWCSAETKSLSLKALLAFPEASRLSRDGTQNHRFSRDGTGWDPPSPPPYWDPPSKSRSRAIQVLELLHPLWSRFYIGVFASSPPPDCFGIIKWYSGH